MNKSVKIQLYKEQGKGVIGYLDLAKDSNLAFTKVVADVSQPDKRKAMGSKTILLSGTPNNNNLLGYIYDINNEDLTFNRNVRQPCCVLVDGEILIDNAFLQITEIKKRRSNESDDKTIQYSAVIKSSLSLFFDKIKDKSMQDIVLTELDFPAQNNTILTPATLGDTFTNTYVDGYKFVLRAEQDGKAGVTDFTPALYVHTLFDLVLKNNGYRYDFPECGIENSQITNVGKDDLFFRRLLIPFSGQIPEDSVKVKDNYAMNGKTTNPKDIIAVAMMGGDFVSGKKELTDEAILNPNLFYQSGYKSPFSGILKIKVNINAEDLILRNNEGGSIYVAMSGGLIQNQQFVAQQLKVRYGTTIYINGVKYITLPMKDVAIIDNGVIYSSGDNVLKSSPTDEIYYNIPVNIGDNVVVYGYVDFVSTAGSVQFKNVSDNQFTVNVQILFKNTESTQEFTANVSNGLMYGSLLDFNLFLPKMKQIDFFKGIINLFNIFIDYDKDDSNRLIFMTRDYYYKQGNRYDLTDLLAKDKEQKITFLSDEVNKRQLFTYKNGKSANLKGYTDSTTEVWGEASFNLDSEFVSGDNKVEIPFTPAPTLFTGKYFIADIMEKDAIYLLLDNGVGNETISIMELGAKPAMYTTPYPITLHNDNPYNPTYDLNFGVALGYYFDNAGITTNNQYNLRYRSYTHQMNTGKKLTCTLSLSVEMFNKLQLNDSIYLRNAWYYINKINDFNPIKTNIVEIEFVTVDDLKAKPSYRGEFKDVTVFPPIFTKPDLSGNNVVFDPATGVRDTHTRIPGIGNVITGGSTVDGNNNTGSGVMIGDDIQGDGGVNSTVPNAGLTELINRINDLEEIINTITPLPTIVRISNFGVVQGEVIVGAGDDYVINIV